MGLWMPHWKHCSKWHLLFQPECEKEEAGKQYILYATYVLAKIALNKNFKG